MRRVQAGDLVRLYGYRGRFAVWPLPPQSSSRADFWAVPESAHHANGFPALEASVVEVKGRPVPLLSAPIAPPADDYPHEPQFQYDDGPQSLGQDAIRIWHERRGL